MPHHRYHPRSRQPRADARESLHARSQGNHGAENDDRLPYAGSDQPWSQDMVDNPDLLWRSTDWIADTSVALYPGYQVPGSHAALGHMMPEDGTVGSYHESHHAFREASWQEPPPTYQHSPCDYLPTSISPTSSSPTDRNPLNDLQAAYSQTVSAAYRSGDNQADSSTPRNWTMETDNAACRTFRRLSTRARHGSASEAPGVDYYDNDIAPDSMNQAGISDSSGGSTPVDQDRYVIESVHDEYPWSPEFPHHIPEYETDFDRQFNGAPHRRS